MHQAESSSSLSCLWTGHSLPAALHPVSRRRSCLRLRTHQCFCPIGTFTLLLVRTFRRTIPGTSCQATIVQSLRDEEDEFYSPFRAHQTPGCRLFLREVNKMQPTMNVA